jgi:hypothetical protein
MASGSGTRQRQQTLSARFNDQEAEAIRQMADRAGMPVASFLRAAALNQSPGGVMGGAMGRAMGRATRRPTVSHAVAARLLGELGRIAEVLRAAATAGMVDLDNPHIAAALRDLAEMRTVCFQAMGRQP